ncbi:MAG: carboxypeptidase-like regulatory domain-containing protein [Coriobacteriia bacterium]|nr:carboxypeptidase-like regulatory domain-containing protein [Coriobacteriia bacterium]
MKRRLLTVLVVSIAMCLMVPAVALAKTSTRLSISASSGYEHYDLKPTITGRLVTASGKPVSKATVKLFCGSTYVGAKRTDAQGRVRFTAELPDARLSGAWRLKYAGSSVRRPVTSSARVTRVHVHYKGPASLLDGGQGLDGDGTEDPYPDEWVTLPESKSSAQIANSEPGLDPGLDSGEPGLDPAITHPAPDDGGLPEDGGLDPDADVDADEGEAYVPTYLFRVDIELSEGRTYGVKLSEPAWCRVDDSSAESVFMNDECSDTFDFSPEADDEFAFLFDTGFGYEDVSELNVLIW